MKQKTGIILMIFLSILILCTGCGRKKETEPAKAELPKQTEEETAAEEKEEPEEEEPVLSPEEQKRIETEEKIEKIGNMQVSIPFGSETETLNGDIIREWIGTDPDGSVSINTAAVREYVNSLSKKHDTFGTSRQFRTYGGETVTVTGGDYGWWMDRPSTTQALSEKILSGESGEFEPVYFGTALYSGPDDIGNTYVEINTRKQHLYVWQNGEMVYDSDFVSGGLMKGNATPDGTYAITYKEKDATLVGENYSSPVKFWMPFNGNIGMHDASWRDTFGGHEYFMNGSHGCVNLPSKSAEKIYDIVSKGEPVVVYGGITKEEAVSFMTEEEQETAMRKGYIEMSPEVAEKIALEKLMEQQAQAAALAALQAAQEGQNQPEQNAQ